MRTLSEFLENVLDKRREAEAYGMRLDLMVLSVSFKASLWQALHGQLKGPRCWVVKGDPDEREDLYIHGVKVVWVGSKMPANQVWFRYSNPRVANEGQAVRVQKNQE